MYHASTILAEDRVEGDMGGSLTQFTDLRHRLPQQTAAWEPYEKNDRGSLGIRHEQPPFIQPNVAIRIDLTPFPLIFLSPFFRRSLPPIQDVLFFECAQLIDVRPVLHPGR
jgi:hypothetical protein